MIPQDLSQTNMTVMKPNLDTYLINLVKVTLNVNLLTFRQLLFCALMHRGGFHWHLFNFKRVSLVSVTDFHLRSSWVRIKVSSKVMLGFEIKVDLCLRFLFYMLVYVQRVKTSKRFGN